MYSCRLLVAFFRLVILSHTRLVTDIMYDYLIIIYVPAPPEALPVFSYIITTSASLLSTKESAVCWNHCFRKVFH